MGATRLPALLLAGALLVLGACAPRAVTPTPVPPIPGPPAPGLPAAEPELRVGVLVDTASVEISSATGFELLDPASQRVLERVGPGQARTLAAGADGALRMQGGTNGALAGAGQLLLVRPTGEGRLLLGGKPYRGSALVRVAGPGRVTAINLVSMEEYLLGVVPHEIGRVGEELLEAAKAQAVAARTYAVSYRGRREAMGFDVFATVQDQVYGGSESEHEVTSRAVRETAGEVLLYEGAPIEAYYHSTCAGRTAAIEEVWPTERPRPYLVSVVDVDPRTGEAYDRTSNRFRWTQRWSAQELTEILSRTLADSLPGQTIREIRDLRILERTQSDRVRRLRIETDAGTVHVGGDRVRWVFLTRPGGPILNSSKFELELVRDPQGRLTEVVANGGGWGHGIGMCQVGAMGRARAGQDYRTILQTYYPAARLQRLY